MGNMRYLIPEAAPGDWEIEILEVQIPIYAPICPLLGGVGHNIDRCIVAAWSRRLWSNFVRIDRIFTLFVRTTQKRTILVDSIKK